MAPFPQLSSPRSQFSHSSPSPSPLTPTAPRPSPSASLSSHPPTPSPFVPTSFCHPPVQNPATALTTSFIQSSGFLSTSPTLHLRPQASPSSRSFPYSKHSPLTSPIRASFPHRPAPAPYHIIHHSHNSTISTQDPIPTPTPSTYFSHNPPPNPLPTNHSAPSQSTSPPPENLPTLPSYAPPIRRSLRKKDKTDPPAPPLATTAWPPQPPSHA